MEKKKKNNYGFDLGVAIAPKGKISKDPTLMEEGR